MKKFKINMIERHYACFEVEAEDIWKKLTPNTDISFEIETLNGKKDENLYKAICFHHDCPTGEKFQIQISNKPIEEIKDE